MNLETGLTADEISAVLGLERHPTRGFGAETYRSSLKIPTGALPDAYESDRPYASALAPITARYAPLASTEWVEPPDIEHGDILCLQATKLLLESHK